MKMPGPGHGRLGAALGQTISHAALLLLFLGRNMINSDTRDLLRNFVVTSNGGRVLLLIKYKVIIGGYLHNGICGSLMNS